MLCRFGVALPNKTAKYKGIIFLEKQENIMPNPLKSLIKLERNIANTQVANSIIRNTSILGSANAVLQGLKDIAAFISRLPNMKELSFSHLKVTNR